MSAVEDELPAATPVPDVPSSVAPAASRRGRRAWLLLAAAGVVGLLVGAGVGAAVLAAATDPTQSQEYRALQSQARKETDQWRAAAEEAASSLLNAKASASAVARAAASRSAELDQREQQLAARESAVAEVEQRVAATSITEGVWVVGRDVEPGTYRPAEPVRSDCYWSITRSGTNGSDIIENDIPGGGYPTVTLREGQDFTNARCGTFIKQ